MESPTMSEQIANRPHHAILLGNLAPGTSVGERDKAVEMGVSRTLMREAIHILANAGLLILRPSLSPVVANPPLKQIEDDLTVIRAIEALSGELACRNASEKDISTVRELHERMISLVDPMDKLMFFETDMKFHRAIARASHNTSLDEVHGKFLARLWRVRYLSGRLSSDRARILRQQGMIVAGLEARDPDLVKSETDGDCRQIILDIQRYFRILPRGTPADTTNQLTPPTNNRTPHETSALRPQGAGKACNSGYRRKYPQP